ncbi:uncharacterized protein T551_02188 [Pneumocystis jirovecii RU7]|uniref:Uncharacterized protein n=1 Tax=Pneumocystis jirovecii (strain RU7) TaxID=1408657 RepID=A0A0W4ZMH2_PNEJ7|nr:uncharacterized protein T551_02188 [Pneumocystis jirovecii RU7]KTW29572.1 hypothetical protein T551_02188 [Pneumocystis jirovecii RU7]
MMNFPSRNILLNVKNLQYFVSVELMSIILFTIIGKKERLKYFEEFLFQLNTYLDEYIAFLNEKLEIEFIDKSD